MRKKFQLFIAALAVTLGVTGLVLAAPTTTYAACKSPADCIQDGVDKAGGSASATADPQEIIQTIVRVLLFLIGAISVIMIIIGGFRYVVSQGDSGNITAAKNTIMYAVIGLIIAIFAWAIVDFVIDNLAK